MIKKSLFLLPLLCCWGMSAVKAQGVGLWTSADAKFGLAKGLSAYVGGEYRTVKGFYNERWALSAGLDYKLASCLKLSADYSFIDRCVESRYTKKGNTIGTYWQPRHRAGLALSLSYKWNRVTFSLRERYQYTYHTPLYANKYKYDEGTESIITEKEYIEPKHRHMLRSRLKVDYNIRKSKFTPFVSGEIYNNITAWYGYSKIRCTAGTEYKVNKKNVLSVFYRYVKSHDIEDADGHVIGIGYEFKL